MMNKLIVLASLALLAVLAMPTASASVTMYFAPQDSCVPGGYCNTTYVELWVDMIAPHDLYEGQFAISYNESCIDVIGHEWGPNISTSWSSWNAYPQCYGPGYEMVMFTFTAKQEPGWSSMLCNITIHCNCSSCGYCTSPLSVSCGEDCWNCPIELWQEAYPTPDLYPDNTTLIDGTVACGTPQSIIYFSKPLYEGWNLISLPLDPEDGTASAVLSTVTYNAIYQYNATSKQFEGIESTDAMDPGTGYFVHITGDCTWNYSGYAYNSMNVLLEQGLNMVGWLNCSKDIDDATSSISGDYHYVARWNTSTQKFEVYNPKAPSAFNDITTMDRGTGYFISAKQDSALVENC